MRACRAAHAARRHAAAQALPRRPQRAGRGDRARRAWRELRELLPGRAGRSTSAAATRSTRASGRRSTLSALSEAAPGSFVFADLVDGPPHSAETMELEVRDLVATVQDPHLRALLDRLLGPTRATWELYRRAPAAKLYHQAYVHGLLEHCLTVAQGVSAMASTFPGIDRDVAVTGALLHDIGKLDAYTADPAAIDLTDAGRLQGEIPLGYYRIRRAIEDLPGFPPQTRAGAAAHRPQPPRLARARQPRGPLHARGVARAHDRQPGRQARLLRSPREGARARRRRGPGSIAASAPAPTSGRSPPSPSGAPPDAGAARPSRRPSRPIKRRSVGPIRMARLRPVPLGPDTLGSGVEVGRSIMRPSRVDAAVRALTRRPQEGHAPSHGRSSLALLLLLALAPTASAHGDDEPDHRDTPADLSGRRHHAHAGHRAPGEHDVARPARVRCRRTWCGTRLTADDSELRRLPVDAAADQGRVRLRQRPAGPVGAVERRAAGRRLAHRAVPRAADRRHGARCASTWAPSAGRSTSTSRSVALPQARAATTRDDDEQLQPPRRTTWRPPSARRHGPRDVFVLGDGLTDPPAIQGVWGIAQVSPTTARAPRTRATPAGCRHDAGPTPRTPPDPSDWQPTVMLHEITHNLGGVQQSAPHSP